MGGGILSRRSVIAAAMLAPFGAAAAADVVGPLTPRQRQERVFDCRRAAAQAELDSAPPEPMTNNDEDRYPDRRASFSKTLPDNELGEVDPTLIANGWRFCSAAIPRDLPMCRGIAKPSSGSTIRRRLCD